MSFPQLGSRAIAKCCLGSEMKTSFSTARMWESARRTQATDSSSRNPTLQPSTAVSPSCTVRLLGPASSNWGGNCRVRRAAGARAVTSTTAQPSISSLQPSLPYTTTAFSTMNKSTVTCRDLPQLGPGSGGGGDGCGAAIRLLLSPAVPQPVNASLGSSGRNIY